MLWGIGGRGASRVLLVGSNLWYFQAGMLGPLFAVFAGRIGGDPLQISWAWATYLAVTGVLIIGVGKLSDRMDKARLMVFGYMLNTAFTFSYLLVTSMLTLAIVEAGLGLANAVATPTWDSLYAKHGGAGSSAGFQWGLAQGWMNIVTATAMFAGGAVVSFLSFQSLFAAMGTVMVVSTVYQVKILRFENAHSSDCAKSANRAYLCGLKYLFTGRGRCDGRRSAAQSV